MQYRQRFTRILPNAVKISGMDRWENNPMNGNNRCRFREEED
jgi:hypothetical protein